MNKRKKTTAQELADQMAEWASIGEDSGLGTYILGPNHEHIPAKTLEWARWYEEFDNRRVAQTFTEHHHISTVFLGIDMSFGGGPPVLYETMVFAKNVVSIKTGQSSGIEHDMDRYCTWEEAEAGHADMVRRVLEFEQSPPEEKTA